MTPAQLSAKGTESGEQKALFAWSAVAHLHGWNAASCDIAYGPPGWKAAGGVSVPQPALRWLHAIPNGGKRDPVTASRLKAEGARKGVADVFLPVARHGCHGLYLEMKTTDGRLSDEQKEFRDHCAFAGYRFVLCRSWLEAATALQEYLS